MADGPTFEQMRAALAAVVGLVNPARAEQLRTLAEPLDEQAFAALAAELHVLPSQLFSAYLVHLCQTTGYVHPALSRVRLQEGARQ